MSESMPIYGEAIGNNHAYLHQNDHDTSTNGDPALPFIKRTGRVDVVAVETYTLICRGYSPLSVPAESGYASLRSSDWTP